MQALSWFGSAQLSPRPKERAVNETTVWSSELDILLMRYGVKFTPYLNKSVSNSLDQIVHVKLRLRSSISSVQSAAAGNEGKNSSAHVVRSRAAIWTLISFKWSQLKALETGVWDFIAFCTNPKSAAFLYNSAFSFS